MLLLVLLPKSNLNTSSPKLLASCSYKENNCNVFDIKAKLSQIPWTKKDKTALPLLISKQRQLFVIVFVSSKSDKTFNKLVLISSFPSDFSGLSKWAKELNVWRLLTLSSSFLNINNNITDGTTEREGLVLILLNEKSPLGWYTCGIWLDFSLNTANGKPKLFFI